MKHGLSLLDADCLRAKISTDLCRIWQDFPGGSECGDLRNVEVLELEAQVDGLLGDTCGVVLRFALPSRIEELFEQAQAPIARFKYEAYERPEGFRDCLSERPQPDSYIQ